MFWLLGEYLIYILIARFISKFLILFISDEQTVGGLTVNIASMDSAILFSLVWIGVLFLIIRFQKRKNREFNKKISMFESRLLIKLISVLYKKIHVSKTSINFIVLNEALGRPLDVSGITDLDKTDHEYKLIQSGEVTKQKAILLINDTYAVNEALIEGLDSNYVIRISNNAIGHRKDSNKLEELFHYLNEMLISNAIKEVEVYATMSVPNTRRFYNGVCGVRSIQESNLKFRFYQCNINKNVKKRWFYCK